MKFNVFSFFKSHHSFHICFGKHLFVINWNTLLNGRFKSQSEDLCLHYYCHQHVLQFLFNQQNMKLNIEDRLYSYLAQDIWDSFFDGFRDNSQFKMPEIVHIFKANLSLNITSLKMLIHVHCSMILHFTTIKMR